MDVLDELVFLSEKQKNGSVETIQDVFPMCRYKEWTYEEIKKLVSMFDHGCSLMEMCNELLRTPRGIAAKLVRLGKIRNRKEILGYKPFRKESGYHGRAISAPKY